MNIVLIGFMGVGKSEVGQRLARELAMNFLDTDELIEKTEGRSINEIFKTEGEEYFRNLETEVLETLQDYDNFVLSTGGGMVLREENVSLLKNLGPLILLWADPEVVYERIKEQTHRPLLNVPDPKEEIKKILDFRSPIYNRVADFKVDTSFKTAEEVVLEILGWLKSKST
ncbi:MAG: shikimate kinase [Candidatus Margulisiibacteriota bacterium]